MAAHKSAAHIGKLMLSNGELLSQHDVDANDMADGFAKKAVEEHRVSTYEVEKWKSDEEEAWHLAKWIGRAVNLACNVEAFPFKDNEASRMRANAAKTNRDKQRQQKKDRKTQESEAVEHLSGRHGPQKVMHVSGIRSGWRCMVCRRMSSTKAKLELQHCRGPVARKWEALAANVAVVAKKQGDGHTRVHSGEVIWCSTCGAYADKKAHKGVHYGGMCGQLRKLMRKIHPETGELMQEHCNTDGSPWGPGMNLYANLQTVENP